MLRYKNMKLFLFPTTSVVNENINCRYRTPKIFLDFSFSYKDKNIVLYHHISFKQQKIFLIRTLHFSFLQRRLNIRHRILIARDLCLVASPGSWLLSVYGEAQKHRGWFERQKMNLHGDVRRHSIRCRSCVGGIEAVDEVSSFWRFLLRSSVGWPDKKQQTLALTSPNWTKTGYQCNQ